MNEKNESLMNAHRYFSANCFNSTWDLLEKPDRTPEEDEQMLQLSMASIWHWTQRDDGTDQNLSVGYWLISRVYAVLGQAYDARRYGELSLQKAHADGIDPFYPAYAYEALARAEWVAGNTDEMNAYLEEARSLAKKIKKTDNRKLLLDDLATIK